MKMCNKEFVVDVEVWDGTRSEKFQEWLGENFLRWDEEGRPVADTLVGEATAHPGWSYIRWADGAVTLSSDVSLARLCQPMPEGVAP